MTTLARDNTGAPIDVLRPGSTEKVVSTGVASNSAAQAGGVVRIATDSDLHYDLDGTATTSSVFLPANAVEYIEVLKGDVISLIGAANVYITETL